MNGQINQNIILEAQKGDLKAFEEILSEYEKPVFGYIVHLVKRREDAEDLTQETFLKLYKSIKKYDSDRKFTTWLFAIANNTTRDWFRKQKRRRELLILDDPEKGKAIEKLLASDDQLSRNNVKFDVALGFRKIKPVYRSVLSLFYLKGFSYKEIAKIKNMPTNTVKTYLYRAKLAMREHLA
ncbi:MAG: RNA polymerase sigma factor [Patescibacteria group bacterium]|nr:RNA polymerase sigma factor [Patescibacteria group bacterium]